MTCARIIALLAFAGCATTSTEAAPVESRIPLSPSNALRQWLDAHAGQLIRLPIVLKMGQVSHSLNGATIGAAPDALVIDINDAAMGIGLADRAHTACGNAEKCAFDVEARWRDSGLSVVAVLGTPPIDALSGYAELVDESSRPPRGPRKMP